MGEENATDQIPNSRLAAIYCRVSSERQEKEGTIQSQLSELERIASENGDILVGRYLDDGYSGELLERPALDKLRNDANKKLFSKVYILSPDRLARKHHYAAIILEDLVRHGIKVVFSNRPVGDTVEDRLLFNIQSVFADYEKAKILDRLRRGKIYKIKQGNVVGNVPPYGYKYVKNENGRRAWYEINEREAEVVRFIFSHYSSGECSGIGGLRRELCHRNIKNRHASNKWSQSMVARILSNETYIGTTHWGKYRSVENSSPSGYRRLKNTARIRRPREEWLPVKVPPIIDEALFSSAKALRASNKRLSCTNAKYNYLLKGLIRCGECGSLMYSKSCHGTSYYVCSKKRNSFPVKDVTCRNSRHFRSRALDDAIWNEFRRIVLSPSVLLDRIRQKTKDGESEKQESEFQIGTAKAKVLALQERRTKLIDAYTDGIITIEELRNRTEELEREIGTLQSQQNLLLAQETETLDEMPEGERLAKFTAQIREVLDGDEIQTRRRLVRCFLSRITLSKEEATVSALLPRALSCVPMSTVSSEPGQNYTGYAFEFAVKVEARRNRNRAALPMAATP